MTYTKYSASGNDFVIFHSLVKKDYSQEAIQLCNRTEGIGSDGLIVLIPAQEHDFEWLFYNSDGSHADMCGNGTRACAHYAYTNQLASSSMSFLTGAGSIACEVNGDIVQTQMTTPVIIKEPFEQEGLTWWLVNTGVPHLVAIVDDLDSFDHDLSAKMRFEHNANVNFAKIEKGKIYVRTYERGVEAETKACGTGMVACFLRAHNLGMVEDHALVYPKSQEELSLSKQGENLFFKGAVKKVFTANII
jgi:diaminopimelate epimerase